MTNFVVSSGATSSGLSLATGDTLVVARGGTAVSTQVHGGSMYDHGNATNTSVGSSGLEIVGSGGLDSFAVISGGGLQLILMGSSLSAFVGGLGSQTVLTGGTATHTVLSGEVPFAHTERPAVQIVESGGIAISTTTMNAYTTQIVLDGGSAVYGNIFSGGGQIIDSGGMATGTILEYGLEDVLSGGYAIGTVMKDFSGLTIGGQVADLVMEGGHVSIEGGLLTSAIISTGFVSVTYGGSANSIVLDGGAVETLGGTRGGFATSTTVNSGGVELLRAEGIDLFGHVASGGLEVISSGGVAFSAKVDDGGHIVVLPGGHEALTSAQLPGAVVSMGVVVDNLGSAPIVYGIAAAGITANNATVYVLSGGLLEQSTVMGGRVDIYAGAVSRDVLFNNASEYIMDGGVDSGSHLSGGTGYSTVTKGGTSISAVLDGSLQFQSVSGYASGTNLENGASQDVASGGLATDTQIGSNSYLTIDPNGSATGSVVSNGGKLVLTVQGSATEVLIEKGGQLVVYGQPSETRLTFDTGASIDFRELPFTSNVSLQFEPSTDNLTVVEGGQSVTLQLAGAYSVDSFTASSDNLSGTEVLISGTPCFCRGTLIKTHQGDVAVETLGIGDHVITASGEIRPIRWIGQRSYDARFAAGNVDVQPIRISYGALAENVPRRDLFVSPNHAMYIDGALIPAFALLNDVSITRAPDFGDIDYFHVELDSHDILLAEGAPTESFVDDDTRGMFQNSNEYYLRHRPAIQNSTIYCAPRIHQGEHLEAIRTTISQRCGSAFSDKAAGTMLGCLKGHLDVVSRDRLAGWAVDESLPNLPVNLELYDNGVKILSIIANGYRKDLEEAGVGKGRHGFDVSISGLLTYDERHMLEVRHHKTGERVNNQVVTIENYSTFDETLRGAVRQALGETGDHKSRERVISALFDQATQLHDMESEETRRLNTNNMRALVIDQNGASAVMPELLVSLQKLGYLVSLATSELLDTPFVQDGVISCHAPFYGSVEEVLRRCANSFDVVLLNGAAVMRNYLSLVRALMLKAKVICNAGDLTGIFAESSATSRDSIRFSSKASAQNVFGDLAQQFDAVLVASSDCASLLLRAAPDARVFVTSEDLRGSIRGAVQGATLRRRSAGS